MLPSLEPARRQFRGDGGVVLALRRRTGAWDADKTFADGVSSSGMAEPSGTTRERMTERLRSEALSAGALAREFEVTTAVALDHVRHIARTLEGTSRRTEIRGTR